MHRLRLFLTSAPVASARSASRPPPPAALPLGKEVALLYMQHMVFIMYLRCLTASSIRVQRMVFIMYLRCLTASSIRVQRMVFIMFLRCLAASTIGVLYGIYSKLPPDDV
jgi:hypothetical protein